MELDKQTLRSDIFFILILVLVVCLFKNKNNVKKITINIKY